MQIHVMLIEQIMPFVICMNIFLWFSLFCLRHFRKNYTLIEVKKIIYHSLFTKIRTFSVKSTRFSIKTFCSISQFHRQPLYKYLFEQLNFRKCFDWIIMGIFLVSLLACLEMNLWDICIIQWKGCLFSIECCFQINPIGKLTCSKYAFNYFIAYHVVG